MENQAHILTLAKKINQKDCKFNICDIVRKSKYKNNFGKRYFPNWSEEVFLITKIENTVLWKHVISDPKGAEIVGTFYEKE